MGAAAVAAAGPENGGVATARQADIRSSSRAGTVTPAANVRAARKVYGVITQVCQDGQMVKKEDAATIEPQPLKWR